MFQKLAAYFLDSQQNIDSRIYIFGYLVAVGILVKSKSKCISTPALSSTTNLVSKRPVPKCPVTDCIHGSRNNS